MELAITRATRLVFNGDHDRDCVAAPYIMELTITRLCHILDVLQRHSKDPLADEILKVYSIFHSSVDKPY